MALRLISAAERLAPDAVTNSIAILGPWGIGKTSLVHTLDPATTLFVNMESGMKSVQTWAGDTLEPATWEEVCEVACLVGGPNPAVAQNEFLSSAFYNHVTTKYSGLDLAKYKLIFADSITDMLRLCLLWSQQTTMIEKVDSKTREVSIVSDNRGAYGKLGIEAIRLMKHMQHAKGRSIVFVGLLEQVKDEFGRMTFEPQMDGRAAGNQLPAIVDQVISYSLFDYDEKDGKPNWQHNWDTGATRGFVCQKVNPFGLPGKDRSGNLDMIEPPDLGRLIDKINLPAKQTHEWLTKQRGDAASSKKEK